MRKMYGLTMLLTILLGGKCAKAQLSVGMLLGASTGNVEIKNTGTAYHSLIQGKNIQGFETGLFIKARIGPVYIRPEALYVFRSGQVSYNTGSSNGSQTFSINKLETPVLIGIHVLGERQSV